MNTIIDILKKVGAILPDDHFVGTSGLHFDTYVNKDALYPHTEDASAVGKLFAEKYKDMDIDAVVAPALGGIILSQWTAHHLTQMKGKEVLGIYTEKTPEKEQIFTRGYDAYIKGKKILVVEDIIVTGGSVVKVVDAVKNAGGEVVGVCCMVNKDPEQIKFDYLGTYPIQTYTADECPLCKNGVPINTKVGHGKKFLEAQNK